MATLRAATIDDAQAIISLNDAVVAVTSPMDASRFAYLFDRSCLCTVAEVDGEIVGFVIAMQSGTDYENANFEWFTDRLNNMVYVDRVVVSDLGRGYGLGSMIYDHVAQWAQDQGLYVMAAEMDLIPPNTGSLRFHEKQGFKELGSRSLPSDKIVSMQVRSF